MVRACFDWKFNRVGTRPCSHAAATPGTARRISNHFPHLGLFTVHAESFELAARLRTAEPVAAQRPSQTDVKLVDAVQRKNVFDRDAAARAERHALKPHILTQPLRWSERLDGRGRVAAHRR